MEEIKVGEYVRTKSGNIGIFKKYAEEGIKQWVQMIDNSTLYTIPTKTIVKHSFNIIDLIEVGDYVNGREVKHIAMFEGFPDYPKLIFVDEKRLIPGETAKNKDIKSIVTKEQFQNIEYRLEEK